MPKIGSPLQLDVRTPVQEQVFVPGDISLTQANLDAQVLPRINPNVTEALAQGTQKVNKELGNLAVAGLNAWKVTEDLNRQERNNVLESDWDAMDTDARQGFLTAITAAEKSAVVDTYQANILKFQNRFKEENPYATPKQTREMFKLASASKGHLGVFTAKATMTKYTEVKTGIEAKLERNLKDAGSKPNIDPQFTLDVGVGFLEELNNMGAYTPEQFINAKNKYIESFTLARAGLLARDAAQTHSQDPSKIPSTEELLRDLPLAMGLPMTDENTRRASAIYFDTYAKRMAQYNAMDLAKDRRIEVEWRDKHNILIKNVKRAITEGTHTDQQFNELLELMEARGDKKGAAELENIQSDWSTNRVPSPTFQRFWAKGKGRDWLVSDTAVYSRGFFNVEDLAERLNTYQGEFSTNSKREMEWVKDHFEGVNNQTIKESLSETKVYEDVKSVILNMKPDHKTHLEAALKMSPGELSYVENTDAPTWTRSKWFQNVLEKSTPLRNLIESVRTEELDKWKKGEEYYADDKLQDPLFNDYQSSSITTAFRKALTVKFDLKEPFLPVEEIKPALFFAQVKEKITVGEPPTEQELAEKKKQEDVQQDAITAAYKEELLQRQAALRERDAELDEEATASLEAQNRRLRSSGMATLSKNEWLKQQKMKQSVRAIGDVLKEALQVLSTPVTTLYEHGKGVTEKAQQLGELREKKDEDIPKNIDAVEEQVIFDVQNGLAAIGADTFEGEAIGGGEEPTKLTLPEIPQEGAGGAKGFMGGDPVLTPEEEEARYMLERQRVEDAGGVPTIEELIAQGDQVLTEGANALGLGGDPEPPPELAQEGQPVPPEVVEAGMFAAIPTIAARWGPGVGKFLTGILHKMKRDRLVRGGPPGKVTDRWSRMQRRKPEVEGDSIIDKLEANPQITTPILGSMLYGGHKLEESQEPSVSPEVSSSIAAQSNLKGLPDKYKKSVAEETKALYDKPVKEVIYVLEGHEYGTEFKPSGEGVFGIKLENFNKYLGTNYTIGKTPTNAEADRAYDIHMQRVIDPIMKDLQKHMDKKNIQFSENEEIAMRSLLWNNAKGEQTLRSLAPNAYKAFLAGDKDTAFEELFSSSKGLRKADGKVVPGLVNRRAKEWMIATRGKQNAPTGPVESVAGLGNVVVPKTPEEAPEFFEKSVLGIYGPHAEAAFNHVSAALLEKIGMPVPDFLKATITEKTLDADVLNSMRVAAYKAYINKRGTSYRDYGESWKLVYGEERSKLGKVGQVGKALSSFFDPGMAAAFTIGESSGVVVKDGRLMIVGDEFNFPQISKKTKGTDLWLNFNSWFADKDAPFSVSAKNRQKIEIDLGPIGKVAKYVKQLEKKTA